MAMDLRQTLARAIFRFLPVFGGLLSSLIGYKTLVTRRESDCVPHLELQNYSEFPVIRARWTGVSLINVSHETRDSTRYFFWRGVLLSPNRRGGYIQTRRELIVPDSGLPGTPRISFPGYQVAGILDQKEGKVLVRASRSIPFVERGIFAGSMAPDNWFHWLIDNLTNVYQARYLPDKYRSFPLLIPAEVKSRTNWLRVLEIVALDREILFIDSKAWHRVGELARIEGVTRPNPRPLERIEHSRIGVMSAPLHDFRDFVLNTTGLFDLGIRPGLRIFIGRRASRYRAYNQDEIFSIAEISGFTLVYMEDLDFEESVRLFRQAEVIVGPHDAGWANLIFANVETKALLWTWLGGEEDNWYENLALFSGVKYRQIVLHVGGNRGEDRRLLDYDLSPAIFRRELAEILGD